MVAVAWLWAGIASSALAQKEDRPVVEIEAHAAGLRGDSFTSFDETRLLAGGSAAADAWGRWSLGVGLDAVWVDQEATSWLYHLRVGRDLPSLGKVEPFLAAGVGGLTTRSGSYDTESDWLVPLVVGVLWPGGAESAWGVRAAVTDYVVWEEVPCGCVNIGGPTPKTGDTSAIHNLAISGGNYVYLGGRSP
jgi:hypothetical protein